MLAAFAVSPTAPRVKIISPAAGSENISGFFSITWEAVDEGDPALFGGDLYYTVDYSHNDGVGWQRMAGWGREAQLAEDFSLYPGGERARVRVVASDGFNRVAPL